VNHSEPSIPIRSATFISCITVRSRPPHFLFFLNLRVMPSLSHHQGPPVSTGPLSVPGRLQAKPSSATWSHLRRRKFDYLRPFWNLSQSRSVSSPRLQPVEDSNFQPATSILSFRLVAEPFYMHKLRSTTRSRVSQFRDRSLLLLPFISYVYTGYSTVIVVFWRYY